MRKCVKPLHIFFFLPLDLFAPLHIFCPLGFFTPWVYLPLCTFTQPCFSFNHHYIFQFTLAYFLPLGFFCPFRYSTLEYFQHFNLGYVLYFTLGVYSILVYRHPYTLSYIFCFDIHIITGFTFWYGLFWDMYRLKPLMGI